MWHALWKEGKGGGGGGGGGVSTSAELLIHVSQRRLLLKIIFTTGIKGLFYCLIVYLLDFMYPWLRYDLLCINAI